METAAPATVLAERHPAQVRVTQLDGHRLVIYQPYLAGDELEGLARPARAGQPAGDSIRMPVAGVSGLATRRFSAGRTVLAIVGGLVFAIVIDCASSGSCGPTLDY